MFDLDTIYNECHLETLARIGPEALDLVVTSPPYDDMDEDFNPIPAKGLRDYDGYSWDFKALAKRLFCSLKEGGVLVWVVGDPTVDGSESLASSLQKIYFRRVGFRVHDTQIYEKANYLPLNHNRYEQSFEYMFVFSKGKPKTFNPIMEKCKTVGSNYNFKTRSSASTLERSGALRARDEKRTTKGSKIKGNIFKYQVGKNKGSKDDIWSHPATFPDNLAFDQISTWSSPGDVVYDPFSGSGTTAVVSWKLGRRFVGSEISKEYCNLSQRRLEKYRKGVLF